MNNIKFESIVYFQPKTKQHVEILEKNSKYPFYNQLDLIKNFFENTDFTEGVKIDARDYEELIVEDKFLIGIYLINDDLDEFKYLFDAFNVYFATEDSRTYSRDARLTKAWRKIMKAAFPNGEYEHDVKVAINQERMKALDEVNADYDKEIESL